MTKRLAMALAVTAWAVFALSACSDDSDTNTCPAGLVRDGDKCVPPPADGGSDGPLADAGDAAIGDATPPDTTKPDTTKPDTTKPTPDGPVPDGPRPDAAPVGPLVVFDDNYGTGITLANFGGATNAVTVDTTEKQSGSASLKIAVPASGYTGGALVLAAPADLSAYDAVTFWAKASAAKTLNTAGLGNTSASTTLQAELGAIKLTTTWTKYIIPIPLASKLTNESGVFHFAEGSDEGAYTIWLDDIRYEKLGSAVLGQPTAAMATVTSNLNVGKTTNVAGLVAIIKVNNVDQTITTAPSYFTFTSSNPAAATVDAAGVVTAVAVGTAEVTAKLGSVSAAGKLTVNVTVASLPTTAAPTPPARSAAKVLSMFSDAYTAETIDTWSATWDMADVKDELVGGNTAKKYTSLQFAGVEFITKQLNASGMTHFHIDIWTPDATTFKVKLVDFGPNKVFDGGDDTAHELVYDAASTPKLTTGAWISLDIPLTSFTGLTNRAQLSQMVLSATNSTVYVDNVYFYQQ